MNIQQITGQLTSDETKEMAKTCLENLSEEDQIQLIRELCLDDQMFCDELVADIEELASQ
jgi:hypothetical protein